MILRPLIPEDEMIMKRLLTDPVIGKTFMLPDYPNEEAAIPLFRRMLELSNESQRYIRGIEVADTLIGFLNDTGIDGDSIELGYVIDPAYHNRGYMTQALSLAIRELIDKGFRHIEAGAFSDNPASIRVMEKCGMTKLEKTDTIAYRNQIHTCVYYAFTARRLRFPCLVLDHDDTVVQSEATVNYPFFVEFLKQHRPGMTITQHEYISACFDPGYIEMCRSRFQFTDEELLTEYNGWKAYIRNHIPAPYEGIGAALRRYQALGGILCVVSQSAQENILRDYRTHFGIEPDAVYGWDLEPEHRKPSPWALEKIMEHYNLSPAQLLVVDDMKAAVGMARAAGCRIAFAGWGRKEFPHICQEMECLCDFAFYCTEEMENFLYE